MRGLYFALTACFFLACLAAPQENQVSICDRPTCKKTYDPVCSSYGSTIECECELKQAMCANPSGAPSIVHKGKCKGWQRPDEVPCEEMQYEYQKEYCFEWKKKYQCDKPGAEGPTTCVDRPNKCEKNRQKRNETREVYCERTWARKNCQRYCGRCDPITEGPQKRDAERPQTRDAEECEDKMGMTAACLDWKTKNQCDIYSVVEQCAKTCGKCGAGSQKLFSEEIRRKTGLQQWRSTEDTLKWFRNLQAKRDFPDEDECRDWPNMTKQCKQWKAENSCLNLEVAKLCRDTCGECSQLPKISRERVHMLSK